MDHSCRLWWHHHPSFGRRQRPAGRLCSELLRIEWRECWKVLYILLTQVWTWLDGILDPGASPVPLFAYSVNLQRNPHFNDKGRRNGVCSGKSASCLGRLWSLKAYRTCSSLPCHHVKEGRHEIINLKWLTLNATWAASATGMSHLSFLLGLYFLAIACSSYV